MNSRATATLRLFFHLAALDYSPSQPRDRRGRWTRSSYVDVTTEWYATATPNSHTVQDAQEYTTDGAIYRVDGHNVKLEYSPHEKEIAELLEKEFGGELQMVPKVNNPKGVSTPDYIFRGKRYDLKTIEPNAGSNTIFNRIKKSERQAHRFVVDISKSGLDNVTVDAQLEKLFMHKETLWLKEIVIIRNNEIVKVIKRA